MQSLFIKEKELGIKEKAQEIMDTCPVGALLKKEKGFDEPIGTRKFDKTPIGCDNI